MALAILLAPQCLTMIPDIHQWLSAFQLPADISQATEFTSLVRSASQYLDLYQHFFPADFQQSMQRNSRRGLLPLPGNTYTLFEMQFLHLVEKHFFPIPEYVFDDPCEENRCFGVPIEPYGLSSIYEYGNIGDAVVEMDLGWQLLLYLTGELQGAFFDGTFDPPVDDVLDLDIGSGRVDRERLRKQCEEQKGPLSFFYLAIAMVEHDTGTAWLDVTYDMPIDDAMWEREVVEELARQFRASEEIWEKAKQFVDWLEEDILHHFTEVVNLWNLCMDVPHLNELGKAPQP
ncbi:MAG: hypothetical protein H0U76_22490 [Ktedonobacteraceae bacterium]|nr:hypothetical protein [Ktedonobacteraceae bacterium]